MSKRDLDWHQQCLGNWRLTIDEKSKQADRLQREVSAAREEIAFYEHQLRDARARGIDAFDRDRFLRVRRKKA